MPPEAKRRRLSFTELPTVSISSLHGIASQSIPSRAAWRREAQLFEGTPTPYGAVLIKLNLPLLDGRVHAWHIVNPLAWLWRLCVACPAFGAFFQQCVAPCGHASIVMYSDETQPGNQLHPDSKRKLVCFYWTVLEFPGWFLNRKCGFFTLGVLKAQWVRTVAVNMFALAC